MNQKLFLPRGALLLIGFFVVLGSGYLYFSSNKKPVFNFFKTSSSDEKNVSVSDEVKQKFDYLSKNGNSSCSANFKDSISSMPGIDRLRGSCCSPMNLGRYKEQTEGLKKYSNIAEIPPDPYDIEVGLAKKLIAHYDDALTPDEQKAYDFAMANSEEKGPCCCKCWRWFVYGGLGKYLIKNYHFTGQQITEVWNLSDGCGGNS